MSQPPHRLIRPRFTPLAAAAGVILAVGCLPSAHSSTSRAPSSAGEGAWVRTAGNMMAADVRAAIAPRLLEARTPSVALDRIDQRGLPLDHTYRHYGSGRGVVVYVFDGGIATEHPELAGRVRVGFTAWPNETRICNAHGTAVAGAIAGTTLGVAPGAQIVDVKMVECARLRGTIEAIVAATEWVLSDHAKDPLRPAIANWSFIADTSGPIPALDSAVARLNAAGISVVVSAGNIDLDACRVSPANAIGAIVVGASVVRAGTGEGDAPLVDARAQGTAYGPCIDVYAPGDSVLLPSLDAHQQPTAQLWSGTSMSAGYVSGAAALYLESHPRATPEQVAHELRTSATVTPLREAGTIAARLLYVGTAPASTTVARR